jgi:hypothetical protein
MPSDAHDEVQRRATYLTLTGLFLTLFGILAWREQRAGQRVNWGVAEVLLLGLAAFRGGRLIAWDHVTEPLRAPFTETVPDDSGAGDTVQPRGTGAQQALGQLLSCPICAGTWVAAGLIYGSRIFPGPARLMLAILGATGAAELANAAAEALSWHGATARRQSGQMARSKRDGI